MVTVMANFVSLPRSVLRHWSPGVRCIIVHMNFRPHAQTLPNKLLGLYNQPTLHNKFLSVPVFLLPVWCTCQGFLPSQEAWVRFWTASGTFGPLTTGVMHSTSLAGTDNPTFHHLQWGMIIIGSQWGMIIITGHFDTSNYFTKYVLLLCVHQVESTNPGYYIDCFSWLSFKLN